MKVCPSCGATDEEKTFVSFFCSDCYLREHDVVRVPEIVIKVCPSCGKVYTDRWRDFAVEDVTRWIQRRVKTDLSDATVTATVITDPPSYIVLVRGKAEGTEIVVQKEGEIKVLRELCPACGRRSGGYYEAIIQVRGKDVGRISKEVIERVHAQGDEYAFVSRVERKKEGVDLYVGSKKAAEKAVKAVARKYGVPVKKSFSVFGERDGKTLTRTTFVLRVE